MGRTWTPIPEVVAPSQEQRLCAVVCLRLLASLFPNRRNLSWADYRSLHGYFFFTLHLQSSVNRFVNLGPVEREQGT